MQYWDCIEVFVEVVRYEFFVGVVRGLGVLSFYVSWLVVCLEIQFGIQLLYWIICCLWFIDVGVVYFEYCVQLFDGFQEVFIVISDYQCWFIGVFKFICVIIFGEKFIVLLVNDFFVEYL